MDIIFSDFGDAHSSLNGYSLSQTLSPDLSRSELRAIWRTTNHQDAKGVIRRGLQKTRSSAKLSNEELQGWVEVYLAYWKAVEEILLADEQDEVRGKVSIEVYLQVSNPLNYSGCCLDYEILLSARNAS